MSSQSTSSCLLAICLAGLVCFTHVAAQSGRRPKPTSSAPPPPVNSQQPTPPKAEQSTQITSIIIVGHDIDPDTKEIWSNDTSTVAEACTKRLKEGKPLGLEILYGGKMKKTQAVERAKTANSSYVLWFGYRSKMVGLDEVIDYLDYVVLLPQTAHVLTEGRVYPNQQKTTADPGGILRLPSSRNKRHPSNNRLLELAGRQIAERVKGVL